eukprot:m.326869 g.326869  ORF g.326869 m.326869 type:complete len:439 (-) comp16488_c0_seq1:71-1387(-)
MSSQPSSSTHRSDRLAQILSVRGRRVRDASRPVRCGSNRSSTTTTATDAADRGHCGLSDDHIGGQPQVRLQRQRATASAELLLLRALALRDDSRDSRVAVVASAQELPRFGRTLTIEIPDNLPDNRIEDGAFQGCKQIEVVKIPRSVIGIGGKAFEGCDRLRRVEWADPSRLGGVSVGEKAFNGCSSLELVSIPPSVDRIGEDAFCGCDKLVSVTLPRALREISPGLFYECVRLRSVTFPSGLLRIGSCAFDGCLSLRSVDLPPNLKIIENYAFHKCCSLTSVDIPSKVTFLGNYAFANCRHLVVATIPGQVDIARGQFMQYAKAIAIFQGCRNLQHVIAPVLAQGSESVRRHFRATPIERLGGLVDDTPANRAKACSLRFWTRRTHRLSSPAKRRWIVVVMLAAQRLSAHGVHLPEEMWIAILECCERHNLGHAVKV